MNNLITKGIIGLATLGLASEYIEHKMSSDDSVVEQPVDNVSIIIPSYNEEKFIAASTHSIREQNIIRLYPEYFELILVDSGSTDNTVKHATPYVDKIINAPRGKLTARNIGTLNSKGNIIVSVDADSIYNNNWLNLLLKPFNDPYVVAVVGSTIDITIPYIPKSLYILASTIDRYVIHPTQMVGRNSAYYKHIFYLEGLFNTNINQQDVHQMLKEEEMNFGKKLSNHGKVHFNLSATCVHLGGEKVGCRMGLINDSKVCNEYQIGIQRFG